MAALKFISVAAIVVLFTSKLISTGSAYQFGLDLGTNQDTLLKDYIVSPEDQISSRLSAAYEVAEPREEFGARDFGYLVDNNNKTNDQMLSLDSLDLQKLIDYLRQPTDDAGQTISSPVNNPADFEAENNQPTSDSNGQNGEIDALLASYLAPLLKELEQHHRQQEQEGLSTKSSGEVSSEAIKRLLESMSYDDMVSRIEKMKDGGEDPFANDVALPEHHYVQGGSGEGRQFLGPDGSFENVQVIKTDRAVPSYCDPPNPCPIGYTEEDGCLVDFVNSAGFSREYQVKQQCSCDNEHSLFNCAAPVSATFAAPTSLSKNNEDDDSTATTNQLDALARAIENRFGGLPSVMNLISRHENSLKRQANAEQPTIVKKAFKAEQGFRY